MKLQPKFPSICIIMPRLRTPHTLLPDLNTEKEKDILQYIPAVQKIEGSRPSVWIKLNLTRFMLFLSYSQKIALLGL